MSAVLVPDGQSMAGQYLTCLVGSDLFAMPLLLVREILEWHGVTEVPMMPPHVRGVINLRGAVVPVIDLRARFGEQQAEITRKSSIVIVEGAAGDKDEREIFGVLVDGVNAVLDLAAEDIAPPPMFGTRVPGRFVAGMGRLGPQAREKFVVMLDLAQVLADDMAVTPAPDTSSTVRELRA